MSYLEDWKTRTLPSELTKVEYGNYCDALFKAMSKDYILVLGPRDSGKRRAKEFEKEAKENGIFR